MEISSKAAASEQPLRVLQIASGDLWAGAEVQLCLLATELIRTAHLEVCVALLNEGELARRLRAAGVAVEVIDENANGALSITLAILRLIKSFSPDVIHTHRTKEHLLGFLANSLAARVPMVRTIHGGREHPPDWRKPMAYLIHFAERLAGKYGTARVIAVSNALGTSLEREGYPNVEVIENGIDADRVRALQRPAPFISQNPTTRHVAFVGRLEPVKRADLFVRVAAALLEQQLPWPVMFHIFGEGAQRPALETLAHDLGIARNIVFHGQDPDVIGWLGSLSAVVLCSDHEGLPMTLLESMAAGTPVVAHAVGGIPDVMRDGVGGTLVESHDTESYARALSGLLLGGHSVEEARRSMSRVRQLYSAPRTAARTAALYLNCLNRR